MDSCGFDKFFHGSNNCSNLSLSEIQQKPEFRDVLTYCSRFNTSFNKACTNCTDAVGKLRDYMLQELHKDGDDNERAVCGLAVVISIAAANMGDPSSIDDLFSCLHFNDDFGKIHRQYLIILSHLNHNNVC